MKGIRGAAAVPMLAAAIAVLVLGVVLLIAGGLPIKVLGLVGLIAGFWLLRTTERLTGAPRGD